MMAMTGFQILLRTIHVRCYRMNRARIRYASCLNYAWHSTILDQHNSPNTLCMHTDSTYMADSTHTANSMDTDIADSREMDIQYSLSSTMVCCSRIHRTMDRSPRNRTASDSRNGIPGTSVDGDSSRHRLSVGHPGRWYRCHDSLFPLRPLPAACSIR